MNLILDIAPTTTGVAAAGGIAFFGILAAVAFIAFKMLKRTVKMAFRMVIVGVILLIAIAGSISFWWLGSSRTAKPENRPRPTLAK